MSVWGIAGVGKSALVDWFYNKNMLDPEAVFPKFGHYCWVNVPHPFSLAQLSWRLLLGLLSDDPKKENMMIHFIEFDQDPIQECRMWLEQHEEWLLVLDGLRSTDEWDTINAAFCLSQPTRGSRIITITNERSVAMHCVNKKNKHGPPRKKIQNKQVVSVQGLSAERSLHLFDIKVCTQPPGTFSET